MSEAAVSIAFLGHFMHSKQAIFAETHLGAFHIAFSCRLAQQAFYTGFFEKVK